MNEPEFTTHIKRLIALYPQRPIPPETIAVYWELLHDLDPVCFALAVRHCALTGDWFPTVHQLRDAADAAMISIDSTSIDRMRYVPERIVNSAVRALWTTPLEDIDDPRGHIPSQTVRLDRES